MAPSADSKSSDSKSSDAKSFDVVVIGAGPGGYPCAMRLAQLGKRVAIIEETYIGGVCLNVGCIPSKAVISAARRFHDMQHAEKYGFTITGSVKLEMAKLQAWKQEVVKKLTGGISQLLKGNGVTQIEGRAELKGATEITVTTKTGEKIELTCKDVVIATGSHPIDLPAFKIDGKNIFGSKEVLEMDKLPERTVVLGGGYIGLELGGALAQLGSQVTVVEMSPKLLAGFDTDCTQVVARRMKQLKVDVRLETKAESVIDLGKKGQSLRVSSKKGSEDLPFDALVVTIGRKPRGKELKLERFGVKVDDKGFVGVDAQLRTSHPHIYAIGDVCGQPMLAHKATRDGEVCAEVIAGHRSAIQNKVIPAVVFCEPELASAGLTEAEAIAQGRKVGTARFPFAALGRALAAGETDGFAKIVFDQGSNVVIGVHIVGSHATDLISEAALAIEMGATLSDLALTIHPHPTLGEGIFEASKVGLGETVHMMPARPAPAAAASSR